MSPSPPPPPATPASRWKGGGRSSSSSSEADEYSRELCTPRREHSHGRRRPKGRSRVGVQHSGSRSSRNPTSSHSPSNIKFPASRGKGSPIRIRMKFAASIIMAKSRSQIHHQNSWQIFHCKQNGSVRRRIPNHRCIPEVPTQETSRNGNVKREWSSQASIGRCSVSITIPSPIQGPGTVPAGSTNQKMRAILSRDAAS